MRSFSSFPARMAAATLVLLAFGSMAHAQWTYTFYPDDTTINSGVTTDFAVVGYASGSFDANFNPTFVSPSSPTIGLGTGANFGATTYLETFNSSTVNITGGSQPGIDTRDNSTLNVYGGTQSSLFGFDHSTVNIAGGSFDFMLLFDNAQVNMSAGYVADLEGQGKSVRISGGTVDTLVANFQTAFSGDILGVCNVTVTGGTIGQLWAYNAGIANVKGGTFTNDLTAFGGMINIYGNGLSATLVNPNYQGFYSLYSVSGSLADGTVLADKNLLVANDGQSRFQLIAAAPEPATLPLLLMTVATFGGLHYSRRKRG